MDDPISTLRSVNMNLLPVLAELLRCANVTRAAQRLHLTQSTVSGSLKQLRDLFGDELLTPRGRDMVLTEKANRLIPEVERLLELAGKIFQKVAFNPSTATNKFRIATADYVAALLSTELVSTIQEQAPFISMSLVPTPGTSAKELRQGTLDLIICPNRRANWQACGISETDEDFSHQVIMRDKWVAIQCGRQSKKGKKLTPEEYFNRPHVMYVRTDGHQTIEEEALAGSAFRQRTQFMIPYFTLLPGLVAKSDLIGIVPQSLAASYARQTPLDVFTPPLDLPPLELVMIWAKNRTAHEDLTWLRRSVETAIEQL